MIVFATCEMRSEGNTSDDNAWRGKNYNFHQSMFVSYYGPIDDDSANIIHGKGN